MWYFVPKLEKSMTVSTTLKFGCKLHFINLYTFFNELFGLFYPLLNSKIPQFVKFNVFKYGHQDLYKTWLPIQHYKNKITWFFSHGNIWGKKHGCQLMFYCIPFFFYDYKNYSRIKHFIYLLTPCQLNGLLTNYVQRSNSHARRSDLLS